MPITTWIRDLLGIPKDIVELKKTKLEVTKLKAELRERNLTTTVSLEDIKKYDPNVQKLVREIERPRKPGKGIVASLELEARRFDIDHPIASRLLTLVFIVGFIIVIIAAIIIAIRSVLNWVE